MKLPPPLSETTRLDALARYQILDSPPEQAFDEITRLTAQLCHAPIALVSLVDEHRQWFKSAVGLALHETPRLQSFCAHAIMRPDEVMIVPDAQADPRFASIPFVTGDLKIRFYAGAPLLTPEGAAIGTLCVMDREPRALAPEERTALTLLARYVSHQLELRRIAGDLATSRLRLEQAQQMALLGGWSYDIVHDRLEWSDEMLRIFGLGRADFSGRGEVFYDRVHPEDRERIRQLYARARTENDPGSGRDYTDAEYRVVRPDGEIRYVHSRAKLTFDENSHALRIIGTAQDFTESKKAQAALRQSEERYRLLFENNPMPMWVGNSENFAFLAVNDAAIRLYGYTQAEFLQMTTLDIRPTDAGPAFLDHVAATRGQRIRNSGPWQHRKKDGTLFPVYIFAHQIEFLGQPARLVLAVDMTEQERALAALRTSEARFRALSESAPIGVFEFDAAGRCVYHNPALGELSGRTLEQNLGYGWRDCTHPDDRTQVRADWERASGDGSVWRNEHRLQRPDGSVRWVRSLAAPSRDTAGVLTGFVGTVEDITERRLAEAALTESEERYRKLLVLSPDAHFVHVEGRIVFANPACCQLLGATESGQLVGKSVLDIVHPDFHEFARHRLKLAVGGQRMSPAHQKYVRLDGSVVDVEAAAMAVEMGGRREVQVVARDITARKRIEEELRSKTAFLEAQVDSTVDGILVVDQDGKKILQSRRFLELMKIPPELGNEYDEAKTLEFVTNRAKDPQAFLERVRYLYAHPDVTSREEIVFKDDSVFDRYSAPVRSADGKHYGRIWVFRDITANKAAEAALRESEQRFKFVAKAVSDVVWDWNLVTNDLWWSESFQSVFGYSLVEIEPGVESWKNRIHPGDLERVSTSIQQAIDTGQVAWASEYQFRRQDRAYAFVQDRGYIIRDATGRAIRMVGGMRDFTEQKRLEAQYLRAQRMESIGTLAGGIAHDLNNVLTPILMSTELLKIDLGDNPDTRKIIDTIYSSARRGADLVRQVLTFARGFDGQRVAINLRHLLADLERIFIETFPRNIRIVCDTPNDLWPILGDPTQIHQVMLNLGVNARDAMPEAGTLTFSASNLNVDAQYAATSPEAKVGTYIVLSVIDVGTGIPPEIRDRIFDPFFTTKEVGKGTGLGLATVHAIVKSHGGFVQVHSEVGVGTTFKVYLPADPALRTARHTPALVALPRGRGELILVIDDEPSIREITQQTLEAFGYRVRAVGDGAEAVALYSRQAKEIALVLTDMMMPVMDGQATIQVLMRLNPAVKIIAASGLNANENVAKAASLGVKDFLAKPYTSETLLRLLRDVLNRPASVSSR